MCGLFVCVCVRVSPCVCVFDIGENPIMPTGKTRGGNVEPITELGPKVVG